jgi:hypothetical protein
MTDAEGEAHSVLLTALEGLQAKKRKDAAAAGNKSPMIGAKPSPPVPPSPRSRLSSDVPDPGLEQPFLIDDPNSDLNAASSPLATPLLRPQQATRYVYQVAKRYACKSAVTRLIHFFFHFRDFLLFSQVSWGGVAPTTGIREHTTVGASSLSTTSSPLSMQTMLHANPLETEAVSKTSFKTVCLSISVGESNNASCQNRFVIAGNSSSAISRRNGSYETKFNGP